MSEFNRQGRDSAPGQPDPEEGPKTGYVVVPREESQRSRLDGSVAMLLLIGTVTLVLFVAWGFYPGSPQQAPEVPAETSPVTGGPRERAPEALSAADASESPAPANTPAESQAPADRPAPASNTGDLNPGYVVQVGAFRNVENAERLQASLRAQDLEATVSVLPTDLHAVDVGPFADRSAAATAAEQVTELTGLTPLVVRDPQ